MLTRFQLTQKFLYILFFREYSLKYIRKLKRNNLINNNQTKNY